MLRLADHWTWDFWFADDGTRYHVFFLRASRALHDPDRRHRRASVGHAVSVDLRTWTLVEDALVAGDAPSFDDLATWTGSVIAGPDGLWRMFYTGLCHADGGRVQRIGVATSADLYNWHTQPDPVVQTDPRWYEQLADAVHEHVHWRDPWVFADPDGDGWHMLVTAHARHGDPDDRGVLGRAWSPDLHGWEVREPWFPPGAGFGQLEVAQLEIVEGRPVLVFSCLADDLPARRAGTTGGTWAVSLDDLHGPFDVSGARLLLDERFYSGRLVRDRAGVWQLLAFHNREPDGSFDGRLSDPRPVHRVTSGELEVG